MSDPIVPCTEDDECGIARICISANASWNENGFDYCDCNTWYGWTGPDCMGFTSTSYFAMAYTSAQLLVILFFLKLLFPDVFKLLRVFGRELKLSASVSTLFMVAFTFTLLFVWRLLYLLSVVMPQADDRVIQAGDTPHGLTFSVVTRPVVVLTQIFSFTAALTVSVIWVEVAQASRSMSTKLVENVTRYKRVVLAIEVLFGVIMITCAALGRFDMSSVVSMPFLMLLLVCYAIGRWRMSKLLREALSQHSGSDSAPSSGPQSSGDGGSFFGTGKPKPKVVKDMAHRTRRALRAINRTAGHVMIALFLLIVSGVLYYGVNALPAAGWQEYAPKDRFSLAVAVASFVPWSMIYINGAVAVYSHRNIRKLIRKRTGVADTSGAGSVSNMLSSSMPDQFESFNPTATEVDSTV